VTCTTRTWLEDESAGCWNLSAVALHVSTVKNSTTANAFTASNSNKNFALRKEAGPPPVWLWRRQHNERLLWTTAFGRRTLFTTVDNVGRQPTFVLSVQQLGALKTTERKTGVVWHQVEQEARGRINIFTYIVLETRISPQERVWVWSECGNRINFLIVFRSNYGSILLSFRDMTTERTTDRRQQPMRMWPLRRTNQ